MKKILRMKMVALMIAFSLLMGSSVIYHPMITQAASISTKSRKTKKKRTRRYFTRLGFDWDNHYLQAGKKEDLSKYVRGAAGLSRKRRAKLIRWKSFKPSVISINKYGLAKAKKAGKARIRCRMKTRKGWKTVVKTLRVFDSRKVSFTVSHALNRGNPYIGKVQKSYNIVFDMVTIRVRNRSKKPVTLKKDLLVLEPEGSYVQTKDRYGTDVWMHCEDVSSLVIPAGKTKNVVYSTEGALSYLKEKQRNNNTCLVGVFTSNGSKKEFRYELPAGKLTITK